MKKKYLSIVLVLMLCLGILPSTVLATGTTYTDIQGHWAESSIERWSASNIVEGYNGSFHPDDALTRGQMAKILANVLSLSEIGENPFADLPEDAWYKPYVLCCYKAGILQGNGANVNPDAVISRQEAMTMLCRALSIAPAEDTDLTSYADADMVADWAVPYVAAMVRSGIVYGVGSNRLDPLGQMTRASILAVLDRAVVQYIDAPGTYTLADGDGLILVATGDVTLTGTTSANILVTSAASGENLTFDKATVTGFITVQANDVNIISQRSTLPEIAFPGDTTITEDDNTDDDTDSNTDTAETDKELPVIYPGETAAGKSVYTDGNGDTAVIPAQFMVSANEDEQTINSGLVIIGPDGSEFVWVPTTVTPLAVHDFGSYFSSGGSLSGYSDETELETYQAMVASVEQYGGFFIGRYEASKGDDGLPVSKRITDSDNGMIWVQFSPQDTTLICEKLYADNGTVQGFFPWGINWDTTLQWLIDSGCKSEAEVASDSTSWGNYSNDSFSEGAKGNLTGQWEETKANNIYDLAGNNWEWTQERYGSSYVMRGGGYNLMGGSCPGDRYPAALRDPLPGNDHHPNVTFRIALYLK